MPKTRWTAALCAAALGGGALVTMAGPASASSHREAPLISEDQVADNTDVYAFRDVNDPNMVNIVANYVPFQAPQGGPNFYKFGDDVLYEVHIDNNGDVNEDITYQFRFSTTVVNPNTFLYNTGPFSSPGSPNLNVRQSYSIRKVDSSGTHMVASGLPVAPYNVGDRSVPNYEGLATQAIKSLPGGGKVFAGPRDDAFFVDTGSVFDLLGLRPLNPAHAIPLAATKGVDGLKGANVHTISLQLPISSVTKNGTVPSVVNSKDSVIGIYASASRQQTKVLSSTGAKPTTSGNWVQVSRLGLPLVNEVLIPLGQKDKWNASDPADDVANFGKYILDPEPAKLIPALYPGVTTPQGGFDAQGNPRRADIVAVLQGAGAGLSGDQLLPPADLLRINLAVPVNPSPKALGILAGDNQGFPNGRRLADDTTDIELRLLAGGTPFTPAFNKAPNNALTDGVDANDGKFWTVFPYQASPWEGFNAPAGSGR